LVYFLLVELLEFRNLGQFEKIAWSIPVDLNGRAFLVDYRKFGLGIFADTCASVEAEAAQICAHVIKAVKVAKPFYEWIADNAIQRSELNVTNHGDDLFGQYKFFREKYRTCHEEAKARKDERHIEKIEQQSGTLTIVHMPAFELFRNANWLAIATIDAFFAWTEHILIHLAILNCSVTTGTDVVELAAADWNVKFRTALDVNDKNAKKHYDALIVIRRQIRNYMAHGAFGKGGEAFRFHSPTGAVPVTLDYEQKIPRSFLMSELAFDDEEAIQALDEFVEFLWTGAREPAKIYIQESSLPIILPMASDGTYRNAMSSVQEMTDLVMHLSRQHDDAANMDW